MKRKKISGCDMSRSGITEVDSDGDRPLIELIAHRVSREPVHCSDRQCAQHQHHGRKDSAYFPF
jgi:hypothetical protein